MIRRPHDLSEVAGIGRDEPAAFGMAIDEFADEFYLSDDGTRQAMLDVVPEPVGDALMDAWIGAVGEHLAMRWGLRRPAWPNREIHFRQERASYHPPAKSQRARLFVESPPAFRRRMVFVGIEPLHRARFPGTKAMSPLSEPVADPVTP